MKYKITTIVLTYNQENLIRETVESVLDQGINSHQIIISDDGSVDKTSEIIKELSSRHENIVPLLSCINTGVTSNCNRAYKACEGEYIAWCGGDDIFLPGKLNAQLKLMDSDHRIAISYHDMDVFDSRTGRTLCCYNSGENRIANPRNGGLEDYIKYGNFMCASSVVTRKQACPKDGFDMRLRIASDYMFFLETASNGLIRYIPQVYGRYRKHDRNASVVLMSDYSEQILQWAIIESKWPQYSFFTRNHRAKYLYTKGIEKILDGNGGLGRTLLMESVRQGVLSLKLPYWLIKSFL